MQTLPPSHRLDPDHPTPTTSPTTTGSGGVGAFSTHSALLWIIVVVGSASALTTGMLVEAASDLPFGVRRTATLGAAEVVDAHARRFWLDRPSDHLSAWVRPKQTPPAVAKENAIAGPATTRQQSSGDGIGPPPTTPADTQQAQPSSTTSSTTSSTVPAAPPARLVSEDDPLRVWAGGDSLGEYVGGQLMFDNPHNYPVDVSLDYHIATGLARPDVFDWPARLSRVVSAPSPPEALVLMIGGNDDQSMTSTDPAGSTVYDYGSPEWRDEYRQRVQATMEAVAGDQRHLWWIGLPPMRDDRRALLATMANAIVAREANQRPWVTFIDIDSLFLDDSGNYARRLEGPDGALTTARAPDGVHVTSAGSEWITAVVWEQLRSHWAINRRHHPHHQESPRGAVGPS